MRPRLPLRNASERVTRGKQGEKKEKERKKKGNWWKGKSSLTLALSLVWQDIQLLLHDIGIKTIIDLRDQVGQNE